MMRWMGWVSSAVMVVGCRVGLGQVVENAPTLPPTGYASVEVLWPGGAPGEEEDDKPKLYSYPAPGDGPHTAVVVLPGGAYTKLVMEKEGAAEARWLNEHGVSAYVPQYRLNPRYAYPWPLADGERAVRFVRAHAKEWKLRPVGIGIWGFPQVGIWRGIWRLRTRMKCWVGPLGTPSMR